MISKCVFTIVVLASVSVYGLELSDNGKKIVKECQDLYSIETEQIQEAIGNKKLPKTENGKCFLQCVMEKSKIINENGEIDVAVAKKINAEKTKDKPDITAKANQVIDTCASEVKKPEGKCDFGVEILKCAVKHAKEMGIPPPSVTNLE